MRSRRMRSAALAGVAAVALGGCAADRGPSMESASADAATALPYGEAAEVADATRTIEIEASDEMAYEPGSISVTSGEIVLFVIHNSGQIGHEFSVGDEPAQVEYAREMKAMADMGPHDHPYGVWLDPGETREFAWRFGEPGEVLYGCHAPGHYESGMVGSIVVEA